jgi:hypothetical protein
MIIHNLVGISAKPLFINNVSMTDATLYVLRSFVFHSHPFYISFVFVDTSEKDIKFVDVTVEKKSFGVSFFSGYH